jgi:hypothetical protein
MKLSKELEILIESMKVVLLNRDTTYFQTLCQEPTIDWERINDLLVYHQVRPIFYEACKSINFLNEVVNNVALYSQRQAIKNLNELHETKRILKLFSHKNIPVLPYKGLLFLEKLYQHRCLREIADVDLIVQPKDAKVALETLLADGYKICIAEEPNNETLKNLIENTPCLEVNLIKKTKIGMNVNIDFHWGINESSNYNLILEKIFKNAQLDKFLISDLLVPDTESIYSMLINHHGNRECWFKLKYIADLIMFQKSNPNLSDDKLTNYSKSMNAHKIKTVATYILDDIFYSKEPNLNSFEINQTLKKIIRIWEEGVNWRNSVIVRYKYLSIYKNLQDDKKSWGSIIKNQIIFHSKVNFIEKKRLVIFPKKYIYLNAFSKLITFLVRVYIHPIFKMK